MISSKLIELLGMPRPGFIWVVPRPTNIRHPENRKTAEILRGIPYKDISYVMALYYIESFFSPRSVSISQRYSIE